MARIVADHGRQRIEAINGVGFYHVYEMSCGCEIRVDERVFLSGSRSSGVNLRDRLMQVADVHDCEVVVHHAPERYRREIRQRRQQEPPITWMGVDIGINPSLSRWFTDWGHNPPQPRRSPAPQTAPEQEVRRAAEQLRGLQVSSVIVDEQISTATPVGFRAPPKEPEKKPDPPRALTRWELLELD